MVACQWFCKPRAFLFYLYVIFPLFKNRGNGGIILTKRWVGANLGTYIRLIFFLILEYRPISLRPTTVVQCVCVRVGRGWHMRIVMALVFAAQAHIECFPQTKERKLCVTAEGVSSRHRN